MASNPNPISIYDPRKVQRGPISADEIINALTPPGTPAAPIAPEATPGPSWMNMGAQAIARVGLPAVGTLLGAGLGPIGMAAGGAAGGMAGEAIAQFLEPTPTDQEKDWRIGSMLVGGALGAVPGSWLMAPGKMGASALRGGALGLAGTAGHKVAEQGAEGLDVTQWGGMDFLPAVLGAGVGAGLGRLSGGTVNATNATKDLIYKGNPEELAVPDQVVKSPLDASGQTGIAHRVVNPTDPKYQVDSTPVPPTTLNDLLSGKVRSMAHRAPEDIERAAMKGDALGVGVKIRPEASLDISNIPVASDAPTIEKIIEDAVNQMKDAPRNLREAAVRMDKAGAGTLNKLAQANDVERTALNLQASGKANEASALRKGAVDAGNASATTARAVIRENEAATQLPIQVEKAHETANKLRASEEVAAAKAQGAWNKETAEAAKVEQDMTGLVPQDPEAVLRTTKEIPGQGRLTVSQRFGKPPDAAADAADDVAGETLSPSSPSNPVVGPAGTRTYYPTREAAIRDMDRAGAVGVIKSPTGGGYVHVFDPEKQAPAVIQATTQALPEAGEGVVFKTIIQAEGAAKKAGLDPKSAVKKVQGGFQIAGTPTAPTTTASTGDEVIKLWSMAQSQAKKTGGTLEKVEGGFRVVPPSPESVVHKTWAAAAGAAKRMGLTSEDVEQVAGGYKIKVPLNESQGAGTKIAAEAESTASMPLDPTLQNASASRVDELMDKFGGTKSIPEARDANPMNADFVERRASGSGPKPGGMRAGDPSEIESLQNPATRAQTEDAMLANAEAEAAAGNPKLDVPESKGGRKFTDESGQAATMAMFRIASTGAGALAGSMMSDDPLAGAIVGGAAGAMAPGALRAAFTKLASNPAASTRDLYTHGENVRETATNFARMVPELFRANLLAHPINLPLNIFVGPLGSTMMAGIEKTLARDPVGPEILKRVFNPRLLRQAWKDSEWEAADRLAMAESRAEGAGYGLENAPVWLRNLAEKPGLLMTRGDILAQRILAEAGVSEAEARVITLTSEPELAISKGIRSFTQGAITEGGKRSIVARMMLPFHRTALNQMEQSLARAPGLGLFVQNLIRDTPDEMRVQLAQQGIGTGVLATSYFVGLVTPPEFRWQVRKVLDNIGGQYGMIASTAYMAGQYAAGGSDWGGTKGALLNLTESDLPVPKMDFARDLTKIPNLVTEPSVQNVPWSIIPFGGAGRSASQISELMEYK